MFQKPFSFDGRIRRLEYGLSFIIYLIVYGLMIALVGGAESMVGLLLVVPMVWFLWAQGAKRCHDINRSGWMQIIPFYVLFLIFEDGQQGKNEYGSNPKSPDGPEDVLESETLDGHLRN